MYVPMPTRSNTGKHLVRMFNSFFPFENRYKTHNLLKHQNFLKKSEEAELKFSVQQTYLLFKKGNIEEIAKLRNIKINTAGIILLTLLNIISFLSGKLFAP